MLILIILLLSIWILLVYEAPLVFHNAVIGFFVLILSWRWPPTVQIIIWILFLIAALLLNIKQLRKPIVTKPVLAFFRKIKPQLSPTEQAGLNAGDVWWDGELFSGRPDWQKLLDTPGAKLTEEEQEFIDGPVNQLCEMIDDWDITHQRNDLPPQAWEFIKEKGFFALIIPKQYGGLEFSPTANSHIITKLATRSLTAAVTVMVPNSLGPAELLLHYGTQQQRNYYLPRLATGEEVPCFALTSPQAGSDAASIPDRGVVCHGQWQGQQVLGMKLNWDKRYITLGPVATLLGLAFRLYDPDHLLGTQTDLGITCALVPVDTPGIEIGKRHNPLNVPFMNGPNQGNDVFVPLDMIIGGQDGAGKGWQMLMQCLSAGRAISLPALSLGAAKLVSRDTGAYAAVRRQFGLAIGRFEGIEEVLTRIAGETWLMNAARDLTCAALNQGYKPAVISAIVKQNLTERMRSVVNDAMDIEGGKGICMGPSNHLAAAYQAIPIGITVEGANILTRSMIIFGQGAIRCHPWVVKEFQAADNNNPDEALEQFDHAFWAHVALSLRNGASTLFYGLTAGLFITTPDSPHKRIYQRLTRFSTAFSLTSDVLMATLGESLKLKEKLTGRMSDILSEMYLLSAALKAVETDPSVDQSAFFVWNCQRSFYRIGLSFIAIVKNLPKPLCWLLRGLIFPLGLHSCSPSDALGKQLAGTLLTPGPLRDLLTSGLYRSSNPDAPDFILEEAFELAVATDPLEKTLRHAVKAGKINPHKDDLLGQAVEHGILTQEQSQQLMRARQLRDRVIAVDAF